MSAFVILPLLAGLLQLTVPSYALRLVRRFGAERVGWFVVVAFSAFALLYLLKPLPVFTATPSGALGLDLACLVASLLLLIAMGYLEALCTTRLHAEDKERQLRAEIHSSLKEQTAALVRLFVDHPQPMWIVELRSGRFLAVNQAALRRFGYSRDEFLTLTVSELMSATHGAGSLQAPAQPCQRGEAGGPASCHSKQRSALELEMTAFDLKFAGSPARLMLLAEASGQQPGKQEEWQRAKMELLTRIAGQTGEHFNSLLAIIEGHTESLRQHPLQSEAAAHLEPIAAATARAAGLTRQLLTASGSFARPAQRVELNVLLRQLAPALRSLAGQHISLQLNLGRRLSPLLAASSQLEEVLTELVRNARNAMPGGGKLTIATQVLRLEPHQAPGSNATRAGYFIRLSVRDTGCGMTAEVQSHLFEPFFTTHQGGQATGLGLARVYGIVKQLGGWIEVTSAPASGTELRIFLPCAAPEQFKAASSFAS